MADYASPQETQRALSLLLDLQEKDPNGLSGILNKYANPFTTWPLLKGPTEAFLNYFKTSQAEETERAAQQNINPKIKELVDEFDSEYADAKERWVTAETASKKFVETLKKHAKDAGVSLPEAQAPVPREAASEPISPERIQRIICAAMQYSGPPEEKTLVFHSLATFASEQPDREIKDLLPRAVVVTEAVRVLITPQEALPKDPLFSPRAAGVFKQLDAVVNHIDVLPKKNYEDMVARWGENFVQSQWFTRLRTDANQMIADQKNTAKIMGKISVLFSDVGTTVFRGPIDPNVIAYIETYRLVAPQGVSITGVSQFGGIAMGYGGQLVRSGTAYLLKKGAKEGAKKIVSGLATKGATTLTAAAAGTALAPGVGTLIGLAVDKLWSMTRGLLNKGAALLKNLLFMGDTKNPEDNLILIVGATVVLMFFLPIFPLLNLPAFNQSMIDTSVVDNVGGGTEGGGAIGSVTLSCAAVDGIYLSQKNPEWGNVTFPTAGCSISSDGCGPTSTTMILNAFGSSATVPDVAAKVAAYDHYDACLGSSVQANLSVLAGAGLSTSALYKSWEEADEVLKNCGLIFTHGTAHRNGKNSGHFIVITGLNWNTDHTDVVSLNTLDPAWEISTQDEETFSVINMWGVVK